MSPTREYPVTGMTCGHCVNAVTEELKNLDGVSNVSVNLDATGTSQVTVTSEAALTDAQVSAALNEAGTYLLVAAP